MTLSLPVRLHVILPEVDAYPQKLLQVAQGDVIHRPASPSQTWMLIDPISHATTNLLSIRSSVLMTLLSWRHSLNANFSPLAPVMLYSRLASWPITFLMIRPVASYVFLHHIRQSSRLYLFCINEHIEIKFDVRC